MGLELNEKNAKEAYCNALACTAIGAAVNHCEDVLPKTVLLVVPERMHDDYPARLLACAIDIGTNDPYRWSVENKEPTIDAETTFQSLWNDWFITILFEG